MSKSTSSLFEKLFRGKYSTVVKILLAIVSFIILSIVSEVLYIQNNNPSQITTYYASYHLNRTQAYIDKSNLQKGLTHLTKATKVKLQEVDKQYETLSLKTSFIVPTVGSNSPLQDIYLDYLRSLDYSVLKQSISKDWSKLFYTLGLLAYQNKELDSIPSLWQTAINLAPDHFLKLGNI